MKIETVLFAICLVKFACGQSSTHRIEVNTGGNNAVVKQCANLMEYCQNHLDCCSKNCLTFSYKCIKPRLYEDDLDIVHREPQQPVAAGAARPNGSVNTVQELVDRFGAGDTENNSPTMGPPTIPAVSLPVPTQHTSINGFVPDNNNNSNNICLQQGRSCFYGYQCCSGRCSRITNMCIEGQETFTNNPQSTDTACYSIGHKCLREEECCYPLRCHGYYHHCVT